MTVRQHTQSTATDSGLSGFIEPSHWNEDLDVDLTDEYTSNVHIDPRLTCTGDGVANDTGALAGQIAAALAVSTTGVSVYLAPDKVYLTDKFTHSSAGALLRFYGGGTLKLRTADDAVVMCAHATATLVLDGIKLDGSNIALTSNARGLAYVTTGTLHVRDCEIFNVGAAATGVSCGIASNTGGILRAYRNNIHNVRGMGIHVQGTGKADVSRNFIHDIGNTAIFVGPINNASTACVSDGYTIAHNIINTVNNELGGTGASGNGIQIYRNSNGSVTGNQITGVAFSFIRINNADNITTTGNRCTTCTESAAWSEQACNYNVWSGNFFKDIGGHGLICTNQGGVGVSFTGNTIVNFGIAPVSATYAAGIVLEYGIAIGNFVDGSGNALARYAIKVGSGGGATANWQAQVDDNQVAGCKYDIGVGVSATGVQRMVIGRTMNIRQDANFASPIGAVGGSEADAGNGSAIGAAMAAKIHWDSNYFNVPTAEAPPVGEIGGRIKINGAWAISDAVAWRPEIPVSVETMVYSASMTPTYRTPISTSIVSVTSNAAFTINAPTGLAQAGAHLTIIIRRQTGSIGTATWITSGANSYRMSAWVQPVSNSQCRAITFQYNGTNWVEVSRTAADVPN